jgi:hypothetical protein
MPAQPVQRPVQPCPHLRRLRRLRLRRLRLRPRCRLRL